MRWLLFVAVALSVSPAFSEEELRVRVIGEVQPDRKWGEYQDNMFRVRMTRIPESDGDVWLTDMFWTAFVINDDLPRFDSQIRLGLHVWAKECLPLEKGLAGWTPDQRMYASLRFDGHIGRAELIAQVCGGGALKPSQTGQGAPVFGIEIDDLQYPLLDNHLFLKARASFWQHEEFHYSCGLSWHAGDLQVYYLFGDSPTWGLRFTATLAGTSF